MKFLTTLTFIIILIGFTTNQGFAQTEKSVNPPPPEQTLTMDFSCGALPEVNIEIYNGLYDWEIEMDYSGGGMPLSNDDEDGKGAVTVANKNNTNGNTTAGGSDIADNQETEVASTSVGRNEIDLMKLVVHRPDGYNPAVSLKLIRKSGEVKLWNEPTKGSEVTEFYTAGETEIVFADLETEIVYYLEAIETSTSYKDIHVQLKYDIPDCPTCEDNVYATAIWVKHVRSFHTRGTPNDDGKVEDGLPDNPVPITDLPNLDGSNAPNINDIIDIINDFAPDGARAFDLSRYGHGTLINDTNIDEDTWIGGRILHEFRVYPLGIENESDLGLVFDVTRQKKARTIALKAGKKEFNPIGTDLNFPYELASLDNETANDDMHNTDEDNIPKNGYIYSFDAPSIGRSEVFNAFVTKRITFKEFVRIKLNSPFANSNAIPEGSRASEKIDWHSALYTRLKKAEGLSIDNDIVSYSDPDALFVKGNIEVELLANADTEGYYLVYFEGDDVWKLQDDSGSPILTSNVPVSSPPQWIIEQTGKVKVTITGNIDEPYVSNDSYLFSVFKSVSPNPAGQKFNQTKKDSSEFDVEINP